MKASSRKRRTRLFLAVLWAAVAIYADNYTKGTEKAHIQMFLWTYIVFALLIIEFRETLKRRAQLNIGLTLLFLHFVLLYLVRGELPKSSSLTILFYALVEGVVVAVLYIRIGQSLDPIGPFGPKRIDKRLAEREEKRRLRWSGLLKKP
jgi:succinate-acetate transporter protein